MPLPVIGYLNYLLALIYLCCLLLCHHAQAEPIMPLEQIRPGMRGYGLTVFQGTTPERFDVEVVGVLQQFLPRQDLILIRLDHPLLERTGTVGGMSGSPIYVQGRLIGALAYGWTFSMDPLAGVTPIENMLEELNRPIRSKNSPNSLNTSHSSRPFHLLGSLTPNSSVTGRSFSSYGQPIPVQSRPWPTSPTLQYWQQFQNSEGPSPAATPLLLGGFSASVRRLIGDIFRDHGLIPIEAGGGSGRQKRLGSAPLKENPFSPGSAIGVQILRGDLSATGIGTVTTTRGSKVVAFGHPMFGYGQQHYPITTAKIITILSSRRRSFKFGEPVEEVGALLQDRQPCIVGDTSISAPMTDLIVTLQDHTTGQRDRYHMEVIQERFLVSRLSLTSVLSALERFASDRTALMVTMRGNIHISGHSPIILEDHAFIERGMTDSRAIQNMTPLIALEQIVGNPFEPVELERIVLDISLEFSRNEAEIIGAYIPSENPKPGTQIPVRVVIRPYGREEELRTIPVDIPRTHAGQEIVFTINGGAHTTPPLPTPYSLEDEIQNLNKSFSSKSLVVTLRKRSQGVSLRGHVAQNLPPSAFDALRPLALDTQERPLTTIEQYSVTTPWVLNGRATIRIQLED